MQVPTGSEMCLAVWTSHWRCADLQFRFVSRLWNSTLENSGFILLPDLKFSVGLGVYRLICFLLGAYCCFVEILSR